MHGSYSSMEKEIQIEEASTYDLSTARTGSSKNPQRETCEVDFSKSHEWKNNNLDGPAF